MNNEKPKLRNPSEIAIKLNKTTTHRSIWNSDIVAIQQNVIAFARYQALTEAAKMVSEKFQILSPQWMAGEILKLRDTTKETE